MANARESCRDCAFAKVLLCAGSTLDLEGHGPDLPDRLGGILSTVVTDTARFGCLNPALPDKMKTVVGRAALNGTTERAKQVVRDFAPCTKRTTRRETSRRNNHASGTLQTPR